MIRSIFLRLTTFRHSVQTLADFKRSSLRFI